MNSKSSDSFIGILFITTFRIEVKNSCGILQMNRKIILKQQRVSGWIALLKTLNTDQEDIFRSTEGRFDNAGIYLQNQGSEMDLL